MYAHINPSTLVKYRSLLQIRSSICACNPPTSHWKTTYAYEWFQDEWRQAHAVDYKTTVSQAFW